MNKLFDLCLDARLYGFSGIGTFLKIILNGLKQTSYRICLLAYPAQISFFTKHYSFAQILPLHSSIYSLKEQYELSMQIPRTTLFWSPHCNIPLFPIRARLRLTTLHDTYHLVHPPKQWTHRYYVNLLYKKACSLSTCVTTVSEYSKQNILRYCNPPPQRLVVLSSGVLPHFKPTPMEETLQKKYTLPSNYLLWVGAIKPHKNLGIVLETYLSLERPEPLVIVGSWKNMRSIDHHALELLSHPALKRRILLLDNVSDTELPSLYSNARLLIFSSLHEGFGLPALEAMACGCPVVAAHATSLPEICATAAEWVDGRQVASLRRGILNILQDDLYRTHLIRLGKERALRFSAQECSQRHLDLLKDLIT